MVVLGLAGTIEDMTTLASQTGLTTNIFRTKYMINRKKQGNEPQETEMNGQRYGNVDMFKYLGSLVTYANEIEMEIKVRTIASKKYYHALGNLLKKICVPF